MQLEVLPGRWPGVCQRIPPSARKDFPTHSKEELQLISSYFSRKQRIRRKTEEYMARVTRPVCVFCWLGW